MIGDKGDQDDGAWRYTLEKEAHFILCKIDCEGLFPGWIGEFAVMPSFYRGPSIKD